MREKEAYFYENSAWRTFLLGGHEFLDNGALIPDSYTQWFFLGTGAYHHPRSRRWWAKGRITHGHLWMRRAGR
jgi:hypothetical protein